MSSARRAKVAAAVKGIREFFALGRSLPPRRPHGEVYGEGVVQEEARRRDMNPDTVQKARAFAHPVTGYTPAELDELCRLVRDTQPGQDDKLAVISRTHVIRLLSVPKRFRPRLQREAITKGWSTAELECVIAARFGSRSAGGRRRRVPTDVLGQLIQIERMCTSWARWAAAAERRREEQPPRATRLSDLPKPVQRLADAATAALAALREEVRGELSSRRPKG